jgi:CUG-BP- and ETR3-like factor
MASESIDIPVKLFIGRFPKKFVEEDLIQIFEPFGRIKECVILRDSVTGESKGCAFIKFYNLLNAINSINKLNNQYSPIEDNQLGTTIQVQFATGEIERLGLSDDQIECPPVKLFVGSIPPDWEEEQLEKLFNKFGTVIETFLLVGEDGKSRGSGFVKIRNKSDGILCIKNLNNLILNENYKLQVRFAQSKKISPTILPPPLPPAVVPTRTVSSSKAGPPGCNVFIFHLPIDWTEMHLRNYFHPFGFILSVTIIRDRQTMVTKGYGFVSYDNPFSAQSAVAGLNGFMVDGKKLKVQVKKESNIVPMRSG